MDENQASKSFDFLNKLSAVINPTRSEIKETCIKLSCNPIPSEYFWILSRQIRFASVNDIQALQKTISELLLENQLNYLSANFAAANFSQKLLFNDYKIGVTSNDEYTVKLLQLFSKSKLNENESERPIFFKTLINYLDYPSPDIQKAAASATVNCCVDKKSLLKNALGTLLKSDTDTLPFQCPMKDQDIRFSGVLILCRQLINEEISVKMLLQALTPILTSSDFPRSSIEAQFLLLSLLRSHPTSFHLYFSQITEFIFKQFDLDNSGESSHMNLQPEFLSAVMDAYGIAAVNRIGVKLLPVLIENFDKYDSKLSISLIYSLIPYLIYFPSALQMSLHQFLVDKCEKRRFDSSLLELTTDAILALAPSVSPYCGQLMEISKGTVKASYIASHLKPLLEPNGPPPPHEVKSVIIVDEKDKHGVEVQVSPSVEEVGIQVDTATTKN